MKKTMILLASVLLILTACSSKNELPKTGKNEVIELPYVVINEQSEVLDEETGKPLFSKVTIESLTRRELTTEENKYFFKKLDYNSTTDLNEEYEILELDFGRGQYLEAHNINKEVYFSEPKLVNGTSIIGSPTKAYLEEENVPMNPNADKHYGVIYSLRKYKYLVKKEILTEKNIQLWLKDDLYLNIPNKEK